MTVRQIKSKSGKRELGSSASGARAERFDGGGARWDEVKLAPTGGS